MRHRMGPSLALLLVLTGLACHKEKEPDAYGNVEAVDVVVGAEASGRIETFQVQEGQTLAAGAVVGAIETTPLALQQQAVQADEDAFARHLLRAVQQDLATLDQLEEAAPLDDRIVALRESIERETSTRLAERVVTAAEYVDKQTDVLEARLLRATHRVERAQAQARLLTVLGLEVR